MAALDQLNHFINFLAPALAVAVVLAILGRLLMKKSPRALGLLSQTAINFIVGTLALGLGLWFFGNDGKMASYAAMVLMTATSQWAGARSGA